MDLLHSFFIAQYFFIKRWIEMYHITQRKLRKNNILLMSIENCIQTIIYQKKFCLITWWSNPFSSPTPNKKNVFLFLSFSIYKSKIFVHKLKRKPHRNTPTDRYIMVIHSHFLMWLLNLMIDLPIKRNTYNLYIENEMLRKSYEINFHKFLWSDTPKSVNNFVTNSTKNNTQFCFSLVEYRNYCYTRCNLMEIEFWTENLSAKVTKIYIEVGSIQLMRTRVRNDLFVCDDSVHIYLEIV